MDASGLRRPDLRRPGRRYPGRYESGNAAQLTGPDDPLLPASRRVMQSWAAMLCGYHLDPAEEIHAMRVLRSLLPGFAVLETTGSFQADASTDDSYAWVVDLIDHGLAAASSRLASTTAATSGERGVDDGGCR